MAIAEINKSGERSLKPVIQDHKGTAEGGAAAINQLVNIERVPFVISTFSGVTLAAQPIAERNKVLMLNVGGTETTLQNKPWLYNNQVLTPRLTPPLAEFAWGEGYRRVAMIYSNDGYGLSNKRIFAESWKRLGGEIVDEEAFEPQATDFGAQLTRIRAAEPDAVMAVAIGESRGLLIKEARSLGIQTPFIGPLGTGALISSGGEDVEGFVDISIAVRTEPEDEPAKRFVDAYQQRYDSLPNWSAGTIYEAAHYLRVLIDSATGSGEDPRDGETLLAALKKNQKFQNFLAGGDVEWLPDHSVSRSLAIREVKQGEFQLVEVVEPSPVGAVGRSG